MRKFLYHRTKGTLFEVLAIDKATGMATLKNEMATFSDTLDAAKLSQYVRVAAENEDQARERGAAKISAEAQAAGEAA